MLVGPDSRSEPVMQWARLREEVGGTGVMAKRKEVGSRPRLPEGSVGVCKYKEGAQNACGVNCLANNLASFSNQMTILSSNRIFCLYVI